MIRPQPGPQELFLSSPADVAVYGGAAGGGKTWALLAEPLRHCRVPGFRAVIFRRESPQITNPGGLWDESQEVYPLAGATAMVGSLEWRFPTPGTRVSFRHLQHDKDSQKWQGAQVALIEFDELPHFEESQFWYLISRSRSTCGVTPYVRASCNPDPGWVKTFLGQWVDRTHPDPAASGELRWMVRVKGEIVWAHTPDELRERHPSLRPRSVTFVRASVFDNKILLERNPEYLGALQSLPRVEQARLLDGDWDVRREGLCYPGLADCVCDFDPAALAGTRCGGIDYGWNHPFCALGAVLDHDDVLWVWFEHYHSFMTLPQHAAVLPSDGTLWWADPARPESTAELIAGGHQARPCVHLGQKPLLDGIDRVTERVRTGRLRVHRRCQNLLREAGLYAFGPDGKPVDADNHAPDALRYLVTGTDRGRAVPLPPRPVPTPEEIEAARLADERRKKAEYDAKRAEWLRPDNPHWWGESDE